PHRSPVSIIDDPRMPVGPRTTPVFKLIGSLQRPDASFVRNAFLKRKAHWRAAVRVFIDITRGAPLLCTGMDESVSLLQELLVEMMAHNNLRPQFLAFFGDDPIVRNAHIVDLVDSFSKFCVIQTTTDSLAKVSMPKIKRSVGTAATQASFINLGVLSHLVTIVNEHLVPAAAKAERHRLLDLLFSPALANWDPFAH